MNVRRFSVAALACLLAWSCEETASPVKPKYDPVMAPPRTLSASEIMAAEGITSIHYVEYLRVTVNGEQDTGFRPYFEYHIDSLHARMNQYYLGTPDWNISVYDLKNSVCWNSFEGEVTYQTLPDLKRAFEQEVQARLGSWIEPAPYFRGSEYVQGKLCDIFSDSSGMKMEWIWREHRIPIQRRSEGYYDVHQITVMQMRSIDINKAFPESLFTPPQPSHTQAFSPN